MPFHNPLSLLLVTFLTESHHQSQSHPNPAPNPSKQSTSHLLQHASKGLYQVSAEGADQDSAGTLRSLTPRHLPRTITDFIAQKTQAESKAAAATPTKVTKPTPKKEDAKKEAPKPETPKKTKPVPVKVTKLARDKNATLPIDVTFQGEIAEAKQVKSHYTHALKLDGAAPFTLVDTVSQYFFPNTACNLVSNTF